MSREFTYELVEGQDKTYTVTTEIDGANVSYICVVAVDSSELADLLEVSIAFDESQANTSYP
jgi:hypothetical protein